MSTEGVESFVIVELGASRYEGCWCHQDKGNSIWAERLGLEDDDIMSKGGDSLALLTLFAKV